MATAAVARPGNALRNRRDAPRPLPMKRPSAVDSDMEPGAKKRKLDEPYVITKEHVLRKFAGKPPSLVLYLEQHFFKFEGLESTYAYDSPMKDFIKHLRQQTIPHTLIENLLSEPITFYDGCLIVEVHNNRMSDKKDKARNDSATEGQVKFSMHNYNSYVTPSPFAPYPKKASEHERAEKAAAEEASAKEKKKAGKDKDPKAPSVATIVMFPTALSQHKEQVLLMNTLASEMKLRRKNADGTTPSSAQPTTPSLAAPPAPLGAGQEKKLCIEEQDMYEFERDLLLATQPPLYLAPVKNPQEADRVLELLAHPLHSEAPPSPKTRKRTSAEMAADDAQAADAERRMLIMDERNKPSVAGASDAAGNAHNIGVSRFKSILFAREKAEEQERAKKEAEAAAATKKRQEEEAQAQAQLARQQQAEQSRKLMMHRQEMARRQQEQANMQRMQQQQQQQQQQHAHPQQANVMMSQQQQPQSFQHPSSLPQSSPVVRNQTPGMSNSSPMVPQNGFSMTATSSQGAGSPVRPTTAVMPNPSVAMARQASQQQPGSRNGTPQMAQSTPHMGVAMQNRQPSQTPRMQHGSPAPGTPAAVSMSNMAMQANGLTQEQMAMLRQQQAIQHMNAGSPGQQNSGQQTMTPEQIQKLHQQQLMRHQMMAQNNPALQNQMMQQRQAMMMQQRQQAQQLNQQRMMAAHNQGQAGSPHPGMQQTPQMGHAHPQQGGGDMNQGQQMTPQMLAARQQHIQKANQQLQQIAQQYGGFHNIPPQIAAQMPQAAQALLHRQRQQSQQTMRAQQMAMRAQAAQQSGQPVASGQADPDYMQTLRQHQAMLAAQQQAQQNGQGGQGGQMGGMRYVQQ
ncbi:hypothetical protein DOTSEDRAFT_69277 [Dothistroma septosporum NZE10]|uniref:Spt20-like SEP domain-containing protein n=1 Tax=Dothistroma septosporum (strain NZE10 / CBS 128990) TaxID=675120 RepID=N1PYH6_DOTSN|nr:hypothetical protein DOTSEDRAFT_69277 [Dothistroma septosporum NZE10]